MNKKSRQKFNYLKNEKSFYDEIKSISHHFYSAFIEANKNNFVWKVRVRLWVCVTFLLPPGIKGLNIYDWGFLRITTKHRLIYLKLFAVIWTFPGYFNVFCNNLGQTRILDPAKHLRWSAFVELVNGYKPLTFFSKKLHHICLTGS